MKGFVIFLTLGVVLLLGVYFLKPRFLERRQVSTSDSKDMKRTIRIGVDNWAGYFPLCSPEMKKRMRGAKYLLQCNDDNADYPGRMKKMRKGELELAVATVDSFLLNGAPEDFPGTIVAVIDESKGGDAILADKRRVRNIEELKSRPGLRIAFTPASPSEHLLKSVAAHFDIPALRERKGAWRVEAEGSSAALAKLEKGEVDAAVLWEPDVSRAVASDRFVKLLGTESTRRLIVDILLVNREFSASDPEAVKILLANYFRTLKTYQREPASLKKDLSQSAKLKAKQVDAMLAGVAWASLTENAKKWFGLSVGSDLGEEGLVDTVESTVQILLANGDFPANPVPRGDPYRLMNSSFVEELLKSAADPAAGMGGDQGPEARDFSPLDEAGWNALQEVGMMKILPITFQSGTADLGLEGREELDKAASHLEHYPGFRVVVKGHTGLTGDPGQNKVLSQERADAVARYLAITHSVNPNRLRAVGLGSSRPLARQPGESDRSHNYRLPRVELHLVAEGL
ncbi:MAG: OmpA family protein [Elusimicrobia bacterium]|nr:OmpA family protein [Elusimicrobiota bacterium]